MNNFKQKFEDVLPYITAASLVLLIALVWAAYWE